MTVVLLILAAWVLLDLVVVGAFVVARGRRRRTVGGLGLAHDVCAARTAALLRP